MTFFALHFPGVDDDRLRLLKAAAETLGMRFEAVDPGNFDFSRAAPAKKGDLVYRISKGRALRRVERYFLQGGATSYYRDPFVGPFHPLCLSRNGIPVPRTVYCMTRDRKILMNYVQSLGGFPVVIKVPGGSRGLGVIKVDTYPSLFGVIDYLLSNVSFVVLRQFIPVRTSARFIVLGKRITAMLEYRAQTHDFRTNEAQVPHVAAKEFPERLQKLAIDAAIAKGLEFGGVDILVKGAKAYVTEVNFPCNFVRAHAVLGKNVALEMVKYLKNKAEKAS